MTQVIISNRVRAFRNLQKRVASNELNEEKGAFMIRLVTFKMHVKGLEMNSQPPQKLRPRPHHSAQVERATAISQRNPKMLGPLVFPYHRI
jgi:hypothetical protein